MTTKTTVEHYKSTALSMLPKMRALQVEHLLDPAGTADQWDAALAGFGQWLWLWQANLHQLVALTRDCTKGKPSINCSCDGCTYNAEAPPGFDQIEMTATVGQAIRLGQAFMTHQARSNRDASEQ